MPAFPGNGPILCPECKIPLRMSCRQCAIKDHEPHNFSWAVNKMREGMIIEDGQGRLYKMQGSVIRASDNGGECWEMLSFIPCAVLLADYWLIVPDPANPDA